MAGPKNKIKVTSPVAGLRRAQLTFVQVLGQSVSAVAPSAVMVTLPALVMPDAGRATIAVFVIAALLMTAVGYCVSQFASRMVAVSGVYSYVVKGLGPVPGFGAGWSLVIGYAAAAMASILGAASYLGALSGRMGLPAGSVSTSVLAVVVGVLALALMVRGIRLSARVSLAIEVFAIIAATAVLIVAFVQSSGTDHTVALGRNDSASGPAIGFGLLIAITSFVGFESAGTVAREARNPLVAVTNAIRWTPLALGALYVLAAALQLPGSVGEGGSSFVLVLSLPDSAGTGASVLSILMELGITASWFACVIGSTTALSRTLFAMGREGVVPRALGRTHSRFHTPHYALFFTMPLIVLVPVAALVATGSSRNTMLGLLAVSAHGYVIAYILVAVAAPTFLWRIGEFSRLPLVVGVSVSMALIVLIGWAALSHTYFAGAATGIYAGLLAVGAVMFIVQARRIPDLFDLMGVYDEPVEDDLLGEYRPWEVRR